MLTDIFTWVGNYDDSVTFHLLLMICTLWIHPFRICSSSRNSPNHIRISNYLNAPNSRWKGAGVINSASLQTFISSPFCCLLNSNFSSTNLFELAELTEHLYLEIEE